MKTNMGLWLDHRQAVIVRVFEHDDEVKRIASNLPKRVRFSGTSHSRDKHDSSNDYAEDKRDRRFEELLNHYYDELIAELANADAILIIGPAEAKFELQKRLNDTQLDAQVLAVEAVDKMTESQIVAKIREHYQLAPHHHLSSVE